MRRIGTAFISVLLFLPLSARAGQPDGSVYIDGGGSRDALILAHGRGRSPTWLVVDPLRRGIHRRLGFHTLSLRMPAGYGGWKSYANEFPDAYRAIQRGISFLKYEKGIERIFPLGHSMGARMTSAFVATNSNHGLSGLIVVGCRNNGGCPLSCEENLEKVRIPVLDLWGGRSGRDSRAAAERDRLASRLFTQVAIPGANHKFEGHEDELVETVASWLTRQSQP